MEHKLDTKELNEMNEILDSVLRLMNGKDVSTACAVLGRAIGILYPHLKSAGAPDELLEALIKAIRNDISDAISILKQNELGFKLNQ